MPIYEYVCSKCSEITEKLQRFDDAPLKSCPHCKGRLKKMMSNTSFVLKGGGWYKDGYGPAAASKSSGNGKGASTAKKTDSKKGVSKTQDNNKKAASAAA